MNIVKKHKVAILLTMTGILFCSPAYSQIEWFPIGAKWYYHSVINDYGGIYLDLLTVEKDTIVDGKTCRLIRGKNTEDIVYEEDGRVYYHFNDKFRKIYDFNVNEGDIVEFEFKTKNEVTYLDTTIVLPMQIESISTRIIDGVELREISAFYVYLETRLYWDYKHIYLEKIGVEYPPIQEGLFPVLPGWVTAEGYTLLRCYHDPNIEYIMDWWAVENKACDYQPSSIEKTDINRDVILFPNPVQKTLVVSGEIGNAQKLTIAIYNILGKVVFEKKEYIPCELNIEHLSSGVYFIQIFDENMKSLISKKIIKA